MNLQKHILVADDEAPLRFIVCRILRKAGYLVSEAPDGRQAHLMILAANQNHAQFDLLLLDMQMPCVCGGRLLTELAQLACCPPLLLMSSAICAPADAMTLIQSRGMIPKPFTAGDLLNAVARAVEPCAAQQPQPDCHCL